MKIRTCFVSNSSSSSCIIFFTPTMEIKPCVTHITGEWWGEGADLVEVTKEIADIIQVLPLCIDKRDLVDVIHSAEDSCNVPKDLPDNARVMSMEVSYYCTDNADDFVERYCCNKYIDKTDYKMFRTMGYAPARAVYLALERRKLLGVIET